MCFPFLSLPLLIFQECLLVRGGNGRPRHEDYHGVRRGAHIVRPEARPEGQGPLCPEGGDKAIHQPLVPVIVRVVLLVAE